MILCRLHYCKLSILLFAIEPHGNFNWNVNTNTCTQFPKPPSLGFQIQKHPTQTLIESIILKIFWKHSMLSPIRHRQCLFTIGFTVFALCRFLETLWVGDPKNGRFNDSWSCKSLNDSGTVWRGRVHCQRLRSHSAFLLSFLSLVHSLSKWSERGNRKYTPRNYEKDRRRVN